MVRRETCVLFALLMQLGLACGTLGQAAQPASQPPSNWYVHGFYLLHLDHHTNARMEVGRDADLTETARLLSLSKPDVIQIHAKGNPGWTTYPTNIGYTPPRLANDVMRLWADLAREEGYVFSAYYNIGRDGEIMKRHPEWNRIKPDGTLRDRALCYHSGVAEGYLWPMIDEIMDRYHPAGFWFDGSCFTVATCYCPKCRARFRREHAMDAPTSVQRPGWIAYKEMQREIYRQFVRDTAARIKKRDPACLVAVNWAYSLRMPEEPPAGVDYLTGDHATRLDDLAPDAIWYDGQSRPFDLMTTVFVRDKDRRLPKPTPQIQQEMGLILAHGGRYFAWDTPTDGSGLVAERQEMLGKVVAPFLRSRQAWCLDSRRLPDVSLFHGAAAHYAASVDNAAVFPRQNPPLLAACDGLRRLHLTPEMVSDRRLDEGDVRGRLLILEDTAELTEVNRQALRRYVEGGGRVLLTGRAIATARLVEVGNKSGLVQEKLGRGEVFCLTQALFGEPAGAASSPTDAATILRQVLPPTQRRIVTEAPDTVELVLREKDNATVLHLVNIAPGKREYDPKTPGFVNMRLTELPSAPACRTALRLSSRPHKVTLEPQDQACDDWTWSDGLLNLTIPAFDVHQMVVIQ
ncbi:MAG: hypothetical protein FJ276_25375 [Planctomycetes bacterium]|nr:hypothetical protein [Planctomycetota bacterium]